MKKILFAAIAVFIAVVFMPSCKKTTTPDPTYPIPTNLKLLSNGYATGSATRVEVYAADSFFVGYNQLYLALYDSATNERVMNADVTLNPMMTMTGSMSHSSPFENPASSLAAEGLFPCAVVFVMPTGSMGSWVLNVQLLNHTTGFSGTAAFSANVLNPTLAKMKSLTTLDDSSKLFISIVKPINPLAGVNDFEIAIHKKTGIMSFPAANDYTTVINPQMMSMGHGSPLNENPIFTANGHYLGKVNYTMSGDWRIYLHLNHNGAVADSSLYFDIIVP